MAGHGARVPVFQLPASGQHERILIIRQFIRFYAFRRDKSALAIRRGEDAVLEDNRIARVALAQQGIGDRVFTFQTFPGDTGHAGHGLAYLIEYIPGSRIIPVQPDAPRDFLYQFQVLAGITRRVNGLATQLYASVGIGCGAGFFRPS